MTLLSQLQKWPQFQAIYTSRTAVSVGQFCVLRYVGFLHQVAICIDKGVLGSASGDTFDQVLNKSFLLFLIRVNSLVALLGLYSCQSGFFFHLGTFEKNLGFSSFYALSGNSVPRRFKMLLLFSLGYCTIVTSTAFGTSWADHHCCTMGGF